MAGGVQNPVAMPTAVVFSPQPTLVMPSLRQKVQIVRSADGKTAATHVTAQLMQTATGPRIVLQGIQGANFTKEQLLSFQQQVKDQVNFLTISSIVVCLF